MGLRLTYENRISENHKVDIHKGKISNVQTEITGTQNKWGHYETTPIQIY